MRPVFRSVSALILFVALLAISGCQMFDRLHPQNTWRLNRGPAMDEGDAYFSISDGPATVSSPE